MLNDLPDSDDWLRQFDSAGLALLTPQEQAEFRRLTTLPLWQPSPGPQEAAFESQADLLGFGGSAGGGKSHLLLGLSITRHQRSIIFRREAAQGRGLIDDARALLGNRGRLNENLGTWRGLPGGRQIEFAGVKDSGDEQKYRGRPHDFIGFDEADQFLESQARFLMGWLRTTVPGQRCRAVFTFNPPSSAEGRWLLDFFGPWLNKKHPHPAKPGELRWFATLPDGNEIERPNGDPFTEDGETITPKSRTFIPSRVTDNPYLARTGYVATLQALPEPLRSQLLFGDFTAGLEDDPWQVIPNEWVEMAQERWKPNGRPNDYLTAVGVDVVRGGADSTVLAPRFGNWFGQLKKYPGKATPDGPTVIGLIVDLLDLSAIPLNVEAALNIDVVGCGASVFDGCRDLELDAQAINFGAGAPCKYDRSGKLGFANFRAYAYWRLREALDPHDGDDIALPPDPELLADLTAPKWSLRSGRIQVEAKEDIIKRIGRSPDAGDAVVLAHLDDHPTSEPPAAGQRRRTSPHHPHEARRR